jgi:hypothetical protein
MPAHFSTRCPNSDYLGFEASPEAIVAAAKKAEEVGFDAVFVNDHVTVGADARSEPWTNVCPSQTDPQAQSTSIARPMGAKDEFLLAAIAQNLRKLAKLVEPQPACVIPIGA